MNRKILVGLLSITLIIGGTYMIWKDSFNPEVEAIPDRMFAGEIHYSRIPVEYWEHRIQMVKAMGLNALSVYVMWNYHEVQKGKFDYETGNRNLPLFLDLAEKYDMKVLFRPGPYVCAEWDFGGMPARLLAIDGLVLRANNDLFLQEVRPYFESLVPIMKKHMQSNQNPKGSIVLLQIENQYGFYGTDKNYIEALRKMWSDLGIDCAQYYVDWVQNIQKCHWTGANIGINNGITQVQWDYVRTFQRNGYLLGGQIYSGWLTHWYEEWQSKSISKNEQEYGFLMTNNHSYSMYMVHGGTNFGLTAGANAFIGEKYNYRAHVTSYDYDAPINEQGSSTPKYQAMKNLIKPFVKWDVIPEPKPISTMSIDAFTPSIVSSMLASLSTPAVTSTSKLIPFESDSLKMFNQGFVVYETNLTKKNYFFKGIVHDYAMVYLDNTYITTLDRSLQYEHDFKVTCDASSCRLRILVQATGHINFDHQMEHDLKGLRDISDDVGTQFVWNLYTIPVDENILKWSQVSNNYPEPTLLKATVSLNVSEIGDTFIDMSRYGKGYVWVNGHLLGRYWNVGPQQRLFCPGVWLKESTVVHILEMRFDGKLQPLEGKRTLTANSHEKEDIWIQDVEEAESISPMDLLFI